MLLNEFLYTYIFEIICERKILIQNDYFLQNVFFKKLSEKTN